MKINLKPLTTVMLVLTILTVTFINLPGVALARGAAPDGTKTPATGLLLPDPNPRENRKDLLAITRVLDMGDSYILFSEFRSDLVDASMPPGSQVSGYETIFKDANGKEINSSVPDIADDQWPPLQHPGAEQWAYQIDKNFAAPLIMTYKRSYRVPAGGHAKAEIKVDVGQDPQPGQKWQLNRNFVLQGYAFRLDSLEAVSSTFINGEGYAFYLESNDRKVSNLDVAIAGYEPIGWLGGGGGPQTAAWTKYTGMFYPQLPKGKLTLVFSNLYLRGGSMTFQLQWSPDPARKPAGPTRAP